MRTRWMLLTAAGLAWSVCVNPEIAFGQPGLAPVPPLPAETLPAETLPAEPPATVPDETPALPAVPPTVHGNLPIVPVVPAVPVGPSVHSSTGIAEPARLEMPEPPQRVRPRYGSLLTNGAYMPVPVPPRPPGTVFWQPGGREGRVGSPDYYSAPGQAGPLYVVHGRRGVPWGYNHSVFAYHFGPGYYRNGEAGHYRFPYYTYRAPWYSPGPPIYNRFTNLPW